MADRGILSASFRSIYEEALRERHKAIVRDNKKRKADNEDLRPQRLAPAARAKQTVVKPRAGMRPTGVINKRIAETDPEKFLRDAFFDKHGNDGDYRPTMLENLSAASKSLLHKAAHKLGLFHETSNEGIMVFGSGKNQYGQNLIKFLNRDDDSSSSSEDSTSSSEDSSSAENESDELGTDEDEVESEEELDDGESGQEDAEWDITGRWTIKCPDMARIAGQFAPYTLDIFTKVHDYGRETYGRFDLGEYKGVFRFSTQRDNPTGFKRSPCKDDIDEFLLEKDDIPCEESPTRCYRWRGKETGEGTIQLGSSGYLYKMTFSNNGRRLTGTFGSHDSEPGDVEFTGTRLGYRLVFDELNIQSEWAKLDKAAYDRASRERWRR
ncbi:hypothetical protein N431DRAFT_430685 [Stipitochalara longipes BDJ]|nr:hypothetical protein N431DRAFT_430685 [Stipitochalara longipes BDJ]